MDPYQVVRDFESALCDYTGAKYAVTTTSCTMAILLACRWHAEQIERIGVDYLNIPSRTYVGVPMSIMHAGFDVRFNDDLWVGEYQLEPLNIYDCARSFTGGMHKHGEMQCVSFHPTKILGISTHGGAILHDNDDADKWLRMMRFDGREEGVDPRSQKDWVMGYHCYMNPVTAAEGLLRLSTLPKYNDPLPNSDYPDLSKLEIFQ